MRAGWLVVLAGVSSCGKQVNEEFCFAHPDDPLCTAIDGGGSTGDSSDAPDGPDGVAHLPASVEAMLTSDADVRIGSETTIDTKMGTITPALSDVVILESVAQDAGPDVMVIQAGSLDIDAHVAVRGDKPLIIVARRTIAVGQFLLDVSANAQMPGPGGAPPGMGSGAGLSGAANPGGAADAGGGGASHGTLGGAGGDVIGANSETFAGGMPGPIIGSAASLLGGSGGGLPSHPGTCMIDGGAGGGAIQLTAGVSIVFNGGIDASGGGGKGGATCGSDGSGGAGGGAGGMVYLQSPMLLGQGYISANGGGGGEGATTGGAVAGVAGGEGHILDGGGAGGESGNTGGNGGDGADGTNTGDPGEAGPLEGNGGGGGGGGGRIYVHTAGSAPSYTTSPPALTP